MSVELYNVTGKSVLKTTSKEISLGSLSAGIYLLKVQTEKGQLVQRLIKQ